MSKSTDPNPKASCGEPSNQVTRPAAVGTSSEPADATAGRGRKNPARGVSRSFRFERDTFTFANELVWQYHFDPLTGAMSVSNTQPPPTYSHRCFVIVRSARQFYFHARFEPSLPAVEPETYGRLIRQVVSRSPRRPSRDSQRLVIPGYDCLRALSQANEPVLKANLGGPWQSYFLRSHWRMVFPVWPEHQEDTALRLRQAVLDESAPAVHLFRFPRITINHGLLLFALSESAHAIQFDAYDPNIPAGPVKLIYDKLQKRFSFPASCYWSGGTVSVVHIFRGGLY